MRRFFLPLAFSMVACAQPTSQAPQLLGPRWLATWTASPSDAPRRPPRDSVDRIPTLVNQTLRLIVRTSIAGDHMPGCSRPNPASQFPLKACSMFSANLLIRAKGLTAKRSDVDQNGSFRNKS